MKIAVFFLAVFLVCFGIADCAMDSRRGPLTKRCLKHGFTPSQCEYLVQ
jgi:hypothetical protein